MNLRWASEWLVASTIAVWLAWTVFVYTYGRPGDTISCVIMDFCNTRGTTVIVSVVVGVLLGHWLWPVVIEVYR